MVAFSYYFMFKIELRILAKSILLPFLKTDLKCEKYQIIAIQYSL